MPVADNVWDLLRFLKSSDDQTGQADASARADSEKGAINDQLMATLESTERVLDEAIRSEVAAQRSSVETIELAQTQTAAEHADDASADIAAVEPEMISEAEPPDELGDPESFLANRAAKTSASEPPKNESADDRQDAEEKSDGKTEDKTKGGEEASSGTLMKISVSRVKPNPFQPRKIMGENEITELSQSIRELGVLQPILVRQIGDAFELVAGERRLRAAQRAGLSEIPAMVVETQPLNQQIIALVENIQRKNLSSIEEAMCLDDIIQKTGWSQTELARRTGRSQASIANKLRLLRLDRSVQDLIISGKLGERQARSLLSLSVEEQRELAQKAIDEDLSARALEHLAENWSESKRSGASSQKPQKEKPDGPAGALLSDLAALINKHRSKGISAQWRVAQKNEDSMVVEISVDLVD